MNVINAKAAGVRIKGNRRTPKGKGRIPLTRLAIGLGLLCRLGVAIWNGFFGPSFGAELDARTFHLKAVDFANGVTPDEFRIGSVYSDVLGALYYVTTDSLFLGSLMSCFVWLSSAIVLIKILRLLSFETQNQFKVMLIYALIPSSILFTSVTLREPYQLLFVNLAIYCVLKIYLNSSPAYWAILFFAVIGMSVLHGALLAFGLFTLIAAFMLPALWRKRATLLQVALATPLLALVVIYGVSLFTTFSYGLDDGLANSVESFQYAGLETLARTNYKTSGEIGGVVGFLLFIPVSLFQYLFEPMPWRISAAADLVPFAENTMRAWLLWRACRGLRSMPPRNRKMVLFVFISYLTLETIWAVGTINWGTATRHHIPSIALLLIAAFAYSPLPLRRKCVTGLAKAAAK